MTPTGPQAATEPTDYTVSQAAARLGGSRITVWRWIRGGRLPAIRLGPRTTHIKREVIERALAQLEVPGSRTRLTEPEAARPRPSSPFLSRTLAAAHSVHFYEDEATLIEVEADEE